MNKGNKVRASIMRAWPCAAAAGLLLLAFPPFNLGLLALCALAPWLASLSNASPKEGWKSGYMFGLLYSGGQFVWLFLFVLNWTHKPLLAFIPTVVASVLYALYFGAVGTLIAMAWKRNWIWAIPLLWAGCEVIRSFLPGLAFPWGLIHTPLWPYPEMIQPAAWGTAYLVSAWVVLVNCVIALVVMQRRWTVVRIPAMVALVVLVGGYVRHSSPWEGKPTKVLIVQPGVEMAFLKPDEEASQIQAKMSELAVRLSMVKADLAIFPEGMARIGNAWPPDDVPFPVLGKPPYVFGASRGNTTRYQSALGYDGQWTFADKRRLVVFGEYVPLRNELPFLKSFNLPSGDLTPGDKTTALQVGGYKVGTMLCFEGLFSDVAYDQAKNGANILAVMSIDDWYMGTPAPEQLMAASAFRAVETGLPLARAASKGISCAFDARGNLIARAPTGETHVLTLQVLLHEKPAYFTWLWIFPWLAALSWIGIPAAYYGLQSRKTKRSESAKQMQSH